MKKIILFTILASVSVSSYANEIYFSKKRMERFSCVVARSIKEAYPDKSLRDFKVEIMDILRKDINPWVDAYPIPAGFSLPKFVEKALGFPGFPMDRSEYYLQNAFILYGNPKRELKESSENYFASFIHLARSRQVAYLNGEAKKFQLRSEDDLIKQIEANLPHVANYTFSFLDNNDHPIMQQKAGAKAKDLYKLAIGETNHRAYDRFVIESQKYNHFSSPLFMWLLEQKDFSVSPEKLFDKAMELYGNPMVALGVIPWVFSGDALTVDRKTSSVVSYKIEKLVEGDDVPGLQYHFWGYLTQGLMGNKVRVGALAYIYEKLYQKDIQDWTIDALSLKTGSRIRSAFKNPDQCGDLNL